MQYLIKPLFPCGTVVTPLTNLLAVNQLRCHLRVYQESTNFAYPLSIPFVDNRFHNRPRFLFFQFLKAKLVESCMPNNFFTGVFLQDVKQLINQRSPINRRFLPLIGQDKNCLRPHVHDFPLDFQMAFLSFVQVSERLLLLDKLRNARNACLERRLRPQGGIQQKRLSCNFLYSVQFGFLANLKEVQFPQPVLFNLFMPLRKYRENLHLFIQGKR